jgi:hypothetical protein
MGVGGSGVRVLFFVFDRLDLSYALHCSQSQTSPPALAHTLLSHLRLLLLEFQGQES